MELDQFIARPDFEVFVPFLDMTMHDILVIVLTVLLYVLVPVVVWQVTLTLLRGLSGYSRGSISAANTRLEREHQAASDRKCAERESELVRQGVMCLEATCDEMLLPEEFESHMAWHEKEDPLYGVTPPDSWELPDLSDVRPQPPTPMSLLDKFHARER